MQSLLIKTNVFSAVLISLLKTLTKIEIHCKGPVKLIKRVKIAHSFLQSVSDQFQVIILSLPM